MLIKALTVGPLATNCYLLCDRQGGSAAMIDPGAEPERILAALSETGCSLVYILLTHGHFDHIGAAAEILSKTGAKLALCADELKLLQTPSLNLSSVFSREIPPTLKADILLLDGQEITLGSLNIKMIQTPGHTVGSCCYRCEEVIFSGDTLFREGAGRTDFPTGDFAELTCSLKRLTEIAGDFRVCPGHGEETALSHEREVNPFMRNVRA